MRSLHESSALRFNEEFEAYARSVEVVRLRETIQAETVRHEVLHVYTVRCDHGHGGEIIETRGRARPVHNNLVVVNQVGLNGGGAGVRETGEQVEPSAL